MLLRCLPCLLLLTGMVGCREESKVAAETRLADRRAGAAPSRAVAATVPGMQAEQSGSAVARRPEGRSRGALRVVYSASTQGWLEPCGCAVKGKEMGGVARRATV
ncbi:MAG: hypothetical protein H0V09_10575, partial [Gemmatimonadetes bacterium]|nr:hypothetical protein [Gemmatimonadota bacterium]